MTLPMALKQLREELQLQQKELAELLSVNSTTVNRWEVGKTRPTKAVRNLLLRVAKENGVSEVCLASLQDALFPKPDLEEKTNDIRYTEINSINQMLNESPNGVIVISLETYDILYMNDKLVALTGISMEEASTMKCYQLLTQEEQPCDICHKEEICIGETFTSVSTSTRYGDCFGRHFTIRTQLITWKGQKALVKYFTDITELHELQQQVEQQQKAINYATEFAGMQVFQYDIQKNTAILMTETSNSKGLPRIVDNFDKTVLNSNIILPEYLGAYNQMLQEIKEGKKQSEAEIRTSEPDGTSNWLHFQMNQTALGENGEPLSVICSVRNINQEKFAYAQLEQEQYTVQDMFTNMPGGVCLYRWNKEILQPVSVSRHFADLIGVDYKSFSEQSISVDFNTIHPDDRQGVREFALRNLSTPGENYTCTFRLWNSQKERYFWVLATVNVIAQGEGYLVYVNYTNIDTSKRMEERIQQEQEMLSDACDFAHIWTWLYDIPRNQIYPSTQLQRDFGMPKVLENFPQAWFDMGFVMPDYVELHRQKVQSIKDGSDSEEFEIQIRHQDGSVHWSHIRFHRLEKNPDLCSCTSQLIDNEKVLQARMELESKKVLSSNRDMMGYVISNISQNYVMERDRKRSEERLAKIGLPIEQQIEAAMPFIMEADRDKYRGIHDRNMLLDAYQKGKTVLEFVGHRLDDDGCYYWMRSVLNLVQDPNTGDIYLYEYLYDIHAQKMLEEITATVSIRDYESISSVNLHTKQMTIIDTDSADSFGGSVVCDYVAHMNQYAQDYIVEAERTMFLTKMSAEYITEALSAQETSEFLYHTIERDGSLHCQRAKYVYYDQEQGICIITRTDVTETMHQEELRSKELAEALNQAKEALETAEVATKAKSDFLSRMSHEIRTPMNAIMGMTAIAQDNKYDFLQVSDCLAKIDSSSQYLLTLINDILEMSRIESGKILLSQDEFDFAEMMEQIRVVTEPIAKKSEIRLELINRTENGSYYGDRIRIQQVMINLLGNALKFTKKSGRVHFVVSAEEETETETKFEFVVEDTGIGMSEKFMQKMFEAFSQEDSTTTSQYGGSGLGLAISKSLVDAMGGTITAESIVGIGTNFTVRISLKKVKSRVLLKPEKTDEIPETEQDAILKGKRILMAEDHPMNIMIAKKLLESKGIQITVAENGKIVVDIFKKSAINEYDTILMDIRMPVMDGLEATRQIRALDRPDAKEIPIIAMTANALEEDRRNSKAAGMDEHLAKPIDSKRMYQILAQQMKRRIL